MRETQYKKIIDMCSDNEFHCQVEFWNLFVRSPHKRRAELAKTGKYIFQDRPCQHGHKNVRDYRLYEIPVIVEGKITIGDKSGKVKIRGIYVPPEPKSQKSLL